MRANGLHRERGVPLQTGRVINEGIISVLGISAGGIGDRTLHFPHVKSVSRYGSFHGGCH